MRTLNSDDWRIFRELRQEALREAPYAFGSTLSEWQGAGDTEERWRSRLTNVPCNLAAYLSDRPAGIVSGWLPDSQQAAQLISMWVAPFARGKGVGDALIRGVVAWARERGYQRVILDVRKDNGAAIALYRRHGFTDAGTIEDAASPCHNELSMELKL